MKEYRRTNLFIVDEGLWKWAKYRADVLEYDSVSRYLFKLVELDQEEGICPKYDVKEKD